MENVLFNQIITRLKLIEEEQNVKILFAVESGSRAWGFASQNSDYDVRFIYAHITDWYLSIVPHRDVIENPADGLIDLCGWDIRKTLQLFLASNPPLLEWIKSPVIYYEQTDFREKLRTLEKNFFSPKNCLYHYLHMAQGNYRKYLQKNVVRVKKYFYVLRPILACQWIEKYNSAPPIEYITLIEQTLTESDLKNEVLRLLERKKSGEELDEGPKIPVINAFLKERIGYYEKKVENFVAIKPNPAILDEIFRQYLG